MVKGELLCVALYPSFANPLLLLQEEKNGTYASILIVVELQIFGQ